MKIATIIFKFVFSVIACVPLISFSQGPVTDTLNFTKVWDATSPQTDAGMLLQGSLRQVKQSATYYDGLGRPSQAVTRQGSLPTASGRALDLVSPVRYDAIGRESVKYLPYVAATADGLYKNDALGAQNSFYSGPSGPVTGQGESYFYSKVAYEPSPLNRVSATLAPGNSWVGAGRGVGLSYGVNTLTDSVRTWTVTNVAGDFGSYTTAGIYPEGSLYKNVTTDESGRKVVEYKDKQGQVVLKKVQAAEVPGSDHTGWLCTYYIYDDLEKLRAVLQPLAVEVMSASGSWTLDNATLNELVFRYEYDGRGRMIRKKVPGSGVACMVYDARDRLVMTQDANMRTPGAEKWLVTQYDDLNRPLKTGLWNNSDPLDHHLNQAYNSDHYPTVSSGWELLTLTHYDDYRELPQGLSIDLAPGYAAYLNFSAVAPDYAAAITASTQTKGLVTWTTVKVLGEDKYLSSVNLYDDRARVIQTQSVNYTGGTDVATTRYDFSGKVLGTYLSHRKAGPNPQTLALATKNNYDDLGRITSVEKNVNNTGWKQVSLFEYDAMGQLKNKKLAPYFNNGQGLETLTYDYNIRGWMLGMNRDYLEGKNSSGYHSRFFGFELGYDKPGSVAGTSFVTPQYNGNISGTVWKSAGDEVRRKYDFTYDPANRFGKAEFVQNTDPSADGAYNREGANFSVHGFDPDNNYLMKYDANGNILSMVQHGIKATTPDVVIDALRYTYFDHSNKLRQVRDDVNDTSSLLGDFKYDPATKTSTDYGYDKNGNLVTDLNKKLTGVTGTDIDRGAITYNHLNVPSLIAVAGRGSIEYVYDASGNKLKKTVHETGKPDRVTLYTTGLVYQDDQLQFSSFEEGRIRPLRDLQQQVTGYAFDYFLKDHLGNVRMVLTDEQSKDAYPVASLEQSTLDSEKRYYRIPEGTRINKANVPGYPQNDSYTSPNDYVQRLNGSAEKVGSSILLRVMSGDRVNIRASSWYRQNGIPAGSPQSALEDIVLSLAQGLTGATGGKMALVTPDQQHVLSSSVAGFLTNQNDPSIPTKPKAYLNWILLDEQLHPVITNDGKNSGSDPVGEDQEFKIHQVTQRAITKNGYLYIYLSNESPNIDVFFDNLQVTHINGPMLEETHYYPFGLEMARISSKAAGGVQNKRGFNGSNELQNREFSNNSGLELYDAINRMYDPQLGRFNQIDELGEANLEWSPYAFSNNNPILLNDPLGLLSTKKHPEELTTFIVKGKHSQAALENTYWYFKKHGLSFDIASRDVRNWLYKHDKVEHFMEHVHSDLRTQGAVALNVASFFVPLGEIAQVARLGQLINLFKLKRGLQGISGLLGGFGTDAAITSNLTNLISKRGWYDVVIHGTKDGLNFIIDDNIISAQQLYSKMLEEGYTQGTKVRLLSCFSGSVEGGSASQLTQLTQSMVIAPKNWITVADGSGFLEKGKIMTGDGLSKLSIFK